MTLSYGKAIHMTTMIRERTEHGFSARKMQTSCFVQMRQNVFWPMQAHRSSIIHHSNDVQKFSLSFVLPAKRKQSHISIRISIGWDFSRFFLSLSFFLVRPQKNPAHIVNNVGNIHYVNFLRHSIAIAPNGMVCPCVVFGLFVFPLVVEITQLKDCSTSGTTAIIDSVNQTKPYEAAARKRPAFENGAPITSPKTTKLAAFKSPI